MVLTKIFLLSSVAVLSYLCYAFLICSPAKSLEEIVENLITDSALITIFTVSGGFVYTIMLWRALSNWFSQNRYYAQRISLDEYNKQKEFYTQSKIYELKNTQEYREYIKNRYSYSK